jgi:hypothetical protein
MTIGDNDEDDEFFILTSTAISFSSLLPYTYSSYQWYYAYDIINCMHIHIKYITNKYYISICFEVRPHRYRYCVLYCCLIKLLYFVLLFDQAIVLFAAI